MGLYLGQMPPTELARLKAELAETLIANFCYPRFFDYRTNALRMRPVDRAKRHEVWSFLSGYDFSAWNRVDILSPDFQRQVERLLIQYIQRNRAFFGEQGRKRMPDIRAMINSSSTTVIEGLRGHVTGKKSSALAFGSPRPVVSWANVSEKASLSWEQIRNATMLLQQQMQEVRGEIKPGMDGAERIVSTPITQAPNGAVPPPPKRVPRPRPGMGGSGKLSAVTPPGRPISTPRPLPQDDKPITNPLVPPASRGVMPPPSFAPSTPSFPGVEHAPSAPSAPSPKQEKDAAPVPPSPVVPGIPVLPTVPIDEVLTIPFPAHEDADKPAEHAVAQLDFPGQAVVPAQPPQQSHPVQQPSTSMRELSKLPPALPAPVESANLIVSDEDVVIFEQLKYQLMLWLRIEALRQSLDITGKSALQLVELLRQQAGIDENRLQVVVTLLGLADEVTARGQANLIDYKQAMMFYLMHTIR